MVITDKRIDEGKAFDWGKTSEYYAKYRDIYPDVYCWKYNLDVVISVGYRVKSKRGIEFRRWANKVLKEYIIK